MNLKGILFDFDGVIVDSMKQHLIAWQYAFRKENVNLEDLEFYLLEGRGVKSVVTDLCKKYSLPERLVPILMKTKIDFYDRHLRVAFYEGFFNLIKFLKSTNIQMGIVTGGHRERVEFIVDKYLNGHFNAIVCSDDVNNTKPYPEPYLKGMKLLGLTNSECLVIENAPLGIQSSISAGIKTIAIETTLGKEYLKEADYIVHSFEEVQSLIKKFL